MSYNETNLLINFIKKKFVIKPSTKSTNIFLKAVFEHFRKYDAILNKGKIERTIKEVTKRMSAHGTIYFPQEIKRYISLHKSRIISYKYLLHGRVIRLNFYTFNKLESLHYYDESAHYTFLILSLLMQFSESVCNKSLTITIFMTHFKRELPSKKGEMLGPINVNGGFTQTCMQDGTITIFRKQEWFKVMIHEAMHSFGLDFSLQNQDKLNKKLKGIFPIDSLYNLFETYTEMWAEILNVSVISYELNKMRSNEFDNFVNLFDYLMALERYYTFFQCAKILNHLNLSYEDLLKSENNYKEGSNIFAYYICKCILYLNYNLFMDWCYVNNSHFFNFTHTSENINSFYEFIRKHYKSKQLFDLLNEMKGELSRISRLSGSQNRFIRENLRLTCVEI